MYNAMSLDKQEEMSRKVQELFFESLRLVEPKYERIFVVMKREGCEMEINTSGGRFSISYTLLMKTKDGYEFYMVRIQSANLEGSVEIRVKCDDQYETHRIVFGQEKEEEPDFWKSPFFFFLPFTFYADVQSL